MATDPSARQPGETFCMNCGKLEREHVGELRFCYQVMTSPTTQRFAAFVAPPSTPAAREPETPDVSSAFSMGPGRCIMCGHEEVWHIAFGPAGDCGFWGCVQCQQEGQYHRHFFIAASPPPDEAAMQMLDESLRVAGKRIGRYVTDEDDAQHPVNECIGQLSAMLEQREYEDDDNLRELLEKLQRAQPADRTAEYAALLRRVVAWLDTYPKEFASELYDDILAALATHMGYTLIPEDAEVRPDAASYVKPSEFRATLATEAPHG